MPQKPRSPIFSLLLLLLAYGLAAWVPAPGNWLRDLRICPWNLCPGIQVQHGMLALMLICAGLGSTPFSFANAGFDGAMRWGGKIALITGLSWILPAVAGILAVVVLSWFPSVPIEVRLAVLIVSAMPVANSTAGWANQLGANISLSLAVLMAATMLSPLITAPLIKASTLASGLQRDGVDALPAWGNDMSTFFALWVLVPIVLGVLLANLLPHRRLANVRPWASQISLLMLLALNYVNGTVCLPGLVQQPGDFVQPLVAAVVLLGSIVVLFALFKRIHGIYKHAPHQPTALVASSPTPLVSTASVPANSMSEQTVSQKDDLTLLLAVVMRNTGAAMVYTSTALVSVPLVSLVVVFYTLMQHLLIGVIISWPRTRSTGVD